MVGSNQKENFIARVTFLYEVIFFFLTLHEDMIGTPKTKHYFLRDETMKGIAARQHLTEAHGSTRGINSTVSPR